MKRAENDITTDETIKQLTSVSFVRKTRLLPSGHILIETPFAYPDGTSIEVFIAPKALLPEVHLTDLGQTTAWLLNLRVKPWLSKKRRDLVQDALHTYDVEQVGGELVVRLSSMELADGVIRLSQACLRVADISFTRRTTLQSTFSEEIEEFINDSDLPYETNAAIVGRYGKIVHVDFAVRGSRTDSHVLTLGSHNPTAAHARATEVFSRWHDLALPERPEQRVTVFDDRSDAYRDEVLKRLEDISMVIPVSEKAELRAVLAT